MRLLASFRTLLFATLLAASHVAFVSHVTAHFDNNVGKCEWCVCQAQTLAGPLPSFQAVTVERSAGSQPLLAKIPLLAEPVSPSYQPRAPPDTV